MPLHAAVLHAAAVVLVVSGTHKLVAPGAVSAALAGSRLPSGPTVGRVIGAGELAIGLAVLVVGGSVPAAALALAYLAFLTLITVNRVRGLDVPCGCIGESDQPPGIRHVAIDTVAAAAGVAGVVSTAVDVTGWLDEGWRGVVALGAVAVLAAAAIVALGPRPSRFMRRADDS